MSTEYEVRKAIEAAEDELRKQGLILPDEATISAYAKSNNMTEEEAIVNIEKEFAAIESSAGYDEKMEGVNWLEEAPASPTTESNIYIPTEEGEGANHAPVKAIDTGMLQEENPLGEETFDER